MAGSTLAARSAGNSAASKAVVSMVAGTSVSVRGSRDVTPIRTLSSSRPAMSASAMPMPSPGSALQQALGNDAPRDPPGRCAERKADADLLPAAGHKNREHAVDTKRRERERRDGKDGDDVSRDASGCELRVEHIGQRRWRGNGRARLNRANARAHFARDDPRVSRRRHEQSEPGLRELPRAQIHGRLTRPLEAAKTLVLHHADDLECFWCSGAPRHSRSGTVHPAADDCSVHVDERFVHDGYTGSTRTVVIGKRAARQDLDTQGFEVTWADYAQLRLSADSRSRRQRSCLPL